MCSTYITALRIGTLTTEGSHTEKGRKTSQSVILAITGIMPGSEVHEIIPTESTNDGINTNTKLAFDA
jgi:hypothetical protein